MASRGQSITLTYIAWDTVNSVGKTGDVANHTLRWVKDGTSAAPTNTPTEVDAVNAKGVYKLAMTTAECTADIGVLAGVSSTAGIVIIPLTVTFEQLPTVAAGANGGLPTVNASNFVAGVVGHTPQSGDSFERLGAPSGASISADLVAILSDTNDLQARLPAALVSGKMDSNAAVVGDKTGYALTQTFPINFSALSISVSGLVDILQAAADKVWSSVARTLTDNLGGIQKNTSLNNFIFLMKDSTDHISPKTGLTVAAQRSIDGAAFAACTNSVTELGGGFYKINFTASDLNGNVIGLSFSATGADLTAFTIITEP